MQIFVERLKWMSASVYLELLALSQCLPGPPARRCPSRWGCFRQGVPGRPAHRYRQDALPLCTVKARVLAKGVKGL